jgi:hypothetical protein
LPASAPFLGFYWLSSTPSPSKSFRFFFLASPVLPSFFTVSFYFYKLSSRPSSSRSLGLLVFFFF